MRFAALIVMTLLAGCAAGRATEEGHVKARVLTSADLRESDGYAPGAHVIRSAEVYQRLVRGGDVPAVDFNRETVLLLNAGPQRTAGYSIALRDARLDGGVLVITADVVPPAPGTIVAQVFTNPAALVAVDRAEVTAVRWVDSSGAELRPVPQRDVSQ